MNLLGIDKLSVADIQSIFLMADKLNYNNRLLLSGKTLILFFPESSIRTRITFQRGISQLGGEVILFPPSTLDKREELKDVAKYLENWADCMVVRHSELDKIETLAKDSSIPVINAMTSLNHPCEILSDIYSIKNMRDDYKNLTYTFVGERGNISSSWVNLARKMDLKLNHVSTVDNRIKEDCRNYRFYTELDEVLSETDIVLTDSLTEKSRNWEYYEQFQITVERMKKCKKNALLNPCPPFFRGEEISGEVIDSEYFVGYEFKKNLTTVQQAIILYCMGIEI